MIISRAEIESAVSLYRTSRKKKAQATAPGARPVHAGARPAPKTRAQPVKAAAARRTGARKTGTASSGTRTGGASRGGAAASRGPRRRSS